MPLSEAEELELLQLQKEKAQVWAAPTPAQSDSTAAPSDPGYGPTADGSIRNPLDVNWWGAIKNELTKPLDPSAKAALGNPLMSAFSPAVGAGATAAAEGLGQLAEGAATSPIPQKIADATNMVGRAKDFVGKIAGAIGDQIPDGVKKALDFASGAIGRKAAYSNPYTAVPQAISDTARLAQGAQKGAAWAMDNSPNLSGAAAPIAAAGSSVYQLMLNSKIWNTNQISKLAASPYGQVIKNAAQSGPDGISATHYILQQTDPEYQTLLKDEQE